MIYLREARIRTTPFLSTSISKPRGGAPYASCAVQKRAEGHESVNAGLAELSAPRGSVVLSVLDWRLRYGDTTLRGWRLSPRGERLATTPRCQLLLICCCALRQNFRRRLVLRLSSEHEWRRHVGRRCRRSVGEDLSPIRTPVLLQIVVVADDHRSPRTFLRRCARREQQCNQHRTRHHKIGKD